LYNFYPQHNGSIPRQKAILRAFLAANFHNTAKSKPCRNRKKILFYYHKIRFTLQNNCSFVGKGLKFRSQFLDSFVPKSIPKERHKVVILAPHLPKYGSKIGLLFCYGIALK